ncbi:uncharacterized protein DFL_002823 [Arthrobotrys flagrans]|uniref:Uncharacterized protein n=1 Tax=Arthrobotrys flagrans TaxID=97331 RepID=A0A437ABY8_ARTFL|nr:hypothetical protein DFL_002823 [Arthrobotrys flagrans]
MRLTGSFPYAQWPVLMPLDKPPGRSESPLGSERSFGFVPPPHPATVLSSDAGSGQKLSKDARDPRDDSKLVFELPARIRD